MILTVDPKAFAEARARVGLADDAALAARLVALGFRVSPAVVRGWSTLPPGSIMRRVLAELLLADPLRLWPTTTTRSGDSR